MNKASLIASSYYVNDALMVLFHSECDGVVALDKSGETLC